MVVTASRGANSEASRLLSAVVPRSRREALTAQDHPRVPLCPLWLTLFCAPKKSRYAIIEPAMNEKHDSLVPRPIADSQSEMIEIVLPNDANPLGALLGGRLMHWIDMAGALAAHRHSRNYVVTASIDHMDFHTPVHVGDMVILRSSVNRVFHTSMEVGVKVFVENYLLDQCQHVSSAYLTFVAIDAGGRHLPVPAVIPETDEQRRRYEDAGRRRDIRRDELERRRLSRS